MVTLADLAESHRLMSNRIADLERLLALQGEINGKLLDHLQRVDEPSPLILPERYNS